MVISLEDHIDVISEELVVIVRVPSVAVVHIDVSIHVLEATCSPSVQVHSSESTASQINETT